MGWNIKAVHLFATASKLAIGGIIPYLLKDKNCLP